MERLSFGQGLPKRTVKRGPMELLEELQKQFCEQLETRLKHVEYGLQECIYDCVSVGMYSSWKELRDYLMKFSGISSSFGFMTLSEILDAYGGICSEAAGASDTKPYEEPLLQIQDFLKHSTMQYLTCLGVKGFHEQLHQVDSQLDAEWKKIKKNLYLPMGHAA